MSLAAETARPPGPDAAVRGLAGLPTPAYVYDLAEIRHNHQLLRAALPARSRLYYSLKANPHPLLGETLAARGALAEVCSPGELRSALAAGWAGADMLYTGPGKRDTEIRDALAHGVRRFSLDSPHALEQLDRLAAGAGTTAECLLRLNDEQPVPGQGLAMTGVPSQFGADTTWVLAEPARFASRPHAKVIGLHLYMGTNLSQVDALLRQFAQALKTAGQVSGVLAEHGVRVQMLDLGGGFGAPYAQAGAPPDLTALRAPLTALLDTEVPGWRDKNPEIAFESGRYLVGTAGTLLTAVLDVKRSHGKDVVVLESGINHLGGMSGLRRLRQLAPDILSAGNVDGPRLEALVAGPLCTPLDTWHRAADLPAVVPGDLVGVPNVGAYGLTASLVGFLGHPLPAEVVIDSEDPGAPPARSRLDLSRTTESRHQE